jgi:phosphoglycerate dehydrogenase-like enzyme
MNQARISVLPQMLVIEELFSAAALAQLHEMGEVVLNSSQEPLTVERVIELIQGSRACVVSQGCPPMTAEILDAAPDLGIIAYGAGSVKGIVTDALWERDITVTSCAAAIAVNVAEMTLACIIVGLKNLWALARLTQEGGWRPGGGELARAKWERSWFPPIRELYEVTIGVVGVSHVGRNLIRMLHPFEAGEVLVYDPYWSVERVAELGARKVELDELLRRSDVVTLHAPALPETRHLLNADNLGLMKDDAVLINTSRGQNIDEAALIAELKKGRFACFLDVTDPEPPAVDSPLRSLPNVILTPHAAGGTHSGKSRQRLGDLVVKELRRFLSGEPPLYPVTKEMLSSIG